MVEIIKPPEIMKTKINPALKKISILFLMLLIKTSAFAEGDEKFNLGGNEQTDKGPLFFIASAGFVALVGIMLFLKIKYDRKKKIEIQEQMKMQAKTPHVSRSRSHGRVAHSRTRGATS